MPLHNSRATFLLLPSELRLRIYEYIFLYEPQLVPIFKPPAERSISPSILRTCKQIHQEASPILYSENTILISDSEQIFQWLTQIGRTNIELLNNIRIWVDAVYSTKNTIFSSARESTFWYKVLDKLAREATGLRHVEVSWDAEMSTMHHGGGKDVRFVRELVKIQGLKSISVNGYYGTHWPRYLSEKMGVPAVELYKLSSLQDLRSFQQGTENLIP